MIEFEVTVGEDGDIISMIPVQDGNVDVDDIENTVVEHYGADPEPDGFDSEGFMDMMAERNAGNAPAPSGEMSSDDGDGFVLPGRLAPT